MITGEGADVVIFNSPHNVAGVSGASDVARQKTLRFWDEALPSRLNRPRPRRLYCHHAAGS